ncbi:hypothetical protein IQ266_23495 [filamentous cyanobacterium LEGE 11480]|uniref:Uncharacterized protein n=1 Tax=Romeriopsis navalis LEGE 11480 TaxID=2777977 RepID=A0A928VQA4_9CYAN|nr:DUF6709 family protein [Romeriopsis navalis]MBE9032706.1 hypothetical protein [Romeriopsis navalis LEGE 11480]
MWDGFIGKQIQRTNRNLLITTIGLVALPASFGIFGMRYWMNFFSGPVKTTGEALVKFDGKIPDRNFITVEGSKTTKTGVKETTTRRRRGRVTSRRVSANYSLLRIGKKLLIVKAKPEDAKSKTFTGELQPLSTKVQNRIIDPLTKKYPKAKSLFLPYMLDQEEDYTFPGYMGLVIGLPCAGFGVWNLLKLKKRKANPKVHPIVKQISGDQDADTVVSTIEQSMSAAQTIGKTTITHDWLFQPSFYGMKSVRLDHLVWFYQKVTTHKRYGIPIRKSYSTVLHDRAGRTIELAAKESQVSEVINLLYAKAPWAVTGYSDDLKKRWTKEREQMITAVDQRRQTA